MAKYGNCEQCGNYGLLGYMPCIKKHICADCASKFLNADAESVRKTLKQQVEAELATVMDEINIGYAKRALLGEGKGLATMQEILARDKPYYERIMAEAKKRLESESEVPDGEFS